MQHFALECLKILSSFAYLWLMVVQQLIHCSNEHRYCVSFVSLVRKQIQGGWEDCAALYFEEMRDPVAHKIRKKSFLTMRKANVSLGMTSVLKKHVFVCMKLV